MVFISFEKLHKQEKSCTGIKLLNHTEQNQKKILMMLNLLLHTQHTILKHIYIHACACRKRLVHTLVVIGRTVHFSSSYSKHFWIKITHIQHTISLAYTHAHLANPINPTACLLLQRPLEFPKIMSLFSCLEY